MKYGIKHDNGEIQAISRFSEDLSVGFELITKEQYDSFIETVLNNAFVTYNPVKKSVEVDLSAQSDFVNEQEKLGIKSKLRDLSIEIDLLSKMSEDTSAKQAEFDNLLIEYNRP